MNLSDNNSLFPPENWMLWNDKPDPNGVEAPDRRAVMEKDGNAPGPPASLDLNVEVPGVGVGPGIPVYPASRRVEGMIWRNFWCK